MSSIELVVGRRFKFTAKGTAATLIAGGLAAVAAGKFLGDVQFMQNFAEVVKNNINVAECIVALIKAFEPWGQVTNLIGGSVTIEVLTKDNNAASQLSNAYESGKVLNRIREEFKKSLGENDATANLTFDSLSLDKQTVIDFSEVSYEELQKKSNHDLTDLIDELNRLFRMQRHDSESNLIEGKSKSQEGLDHVATEGNEKPLDTNTTALENIQKRLDVLEMSSENRRKKKNYRPKLKTAFLVVIIAFVIGIFYVYDMKVAAVEVAVESLKQEKVAKIISFMEHKYPDAFLCLVGMKDGRVADKDITSSGFAIDDHHSHIHARLDNQPSKAVEVGAWQANPSKF